MSNQFNVIVVSSPPRGVVEEVLLSGTPSPGTCLSVLAATEPVNGKFTYELWNRGADGDNGEIAILLEDELQGKIVTAAYVTGTLARVYFPANGELLQMLYKNESGTSDSFAIGDIMMVDDGTGKIIATTGTPEVEAFTCMETQAGITVDTLVLSRYNGS